MTFISSTRAAKTAWTCSNHLKWLANELPVTFLYAGVGLAGYVNLIWPHLLL